MSDSESSENAVSSQPPPPSPAEVLAGKIGSLQSQLNSMRSSVLMASLKDEIDDVNTTLNNLPTLIGKIRTAGHVFDADLEKKSDEMRANWLKCVITRRVKLTLTSIRCKTLCKTPRANCKT